MWIKEGRGWLNKKTSWFYAVVYFVWLYEEKKTILSDDNAFVKSDERGTVWINDKRGWLNKETSWFYAVDCFVWL